MTVDNDVKLGAFHKLPHGERLSLIYLTWIKFCVERKFAVLVFFVEIPRKLNHAKCTKFGQPRKLVRAKFSSCFLDFVMERKQSFFSISFYYDSFFSCFLHLQSLRKITFLRLRLGFRSFSGLLAV